MENNTLKNNPFISLFPSVEAAKQYARSCKLAKCGDICSSSSTNENLSSIPLKNKHTPNDAETSSLEKTLLEWLLLVTPGSLVVNTWHPCTQLRECSIEFAANSVNMILFDRLLLEKPYTVAQPTDAQGCSDTHRWWNNLNDIHSKVEEHRVLYYLLDVYDRCNDARKQILLTKRYNNLVHGVIEIVEREVLTNFHTAVHQPQLYEGQDVLGQLKSLLSVKLTEKETFDQLIMHYLQKVVEEKYELPIPFSEILLMAETQLRGCDLLSVDWKCVQLLEFFAHHPLLTDILLKVPAPLSRTLAGSPYPPGSIYQTTALGRLLSISCLPNHQAQLSRFFTDSSRLTKEEVTAVNMSIETTQRMLTDRCCQMFKIMLKRSDSKPLLLLWLDECLASNLGRAGLWHVAGGAGDLSARQYVSDGFMINLATILATLAHRFTNDIVEDKVTHAIMMVDPSYCVAPRSVSGCYPCNLSSLTTLTRPTAEASTPPLPDKFTFTSTCFFFANCALHLGLNVVNQRLGRVQQELNRLHRHSQDSPDHSIRDVLKERIATLTSTYLTLRAAMIPQANDLAVTHLLAASAHWLVQISQQPATSAWNSCHRPHVAVVTPLPETGTQDPVPTEHSWLQFVPEFMVDNIAQLSTLTRMLNAGDNSPLFDLPVNKTLLTFIISFMGSAGRVKNPHLRAELARTLELVLLGEPLSSSSDQNKSSSYASVLPGLWDQLVVKHELGRHLPIALLRVFVSIEMTGQSVTFEDKFKYRGPMYEIMKQLWQVDAQRQVFVELSQQALGDMEASEPPLFLRFVNLLINDNIFLLDEGLSYMMQLKEMQQQKSEWESLPATARAEKEQMMQHTAMLARFHNLLARRTSATLAMLAEVTAPLFCHRTLVDRVAAMLNYFLDHLVGPKQRQLKVRDTDQYEFRPGVVVGLICRLYVSLSEEEQFAAAVIRDDRSYSPTLLKKAYDVLVRVGEYNLAQQLAVVQKCVSGASKHQQEEDDLTQAAPEHFLDPIMSVLMRDPVLLPTSGMIVDRGTIARHLLSDQIDPFNRQPLTMAQVVPAADRAAEIQQWLRERAARSGAPVGEGGIIETRSECEMDVVLESAAGDTSRVKKTNETDTVSDSTKENLTGSLAEGR